MDPSSSSRTLTEMSADDQFESTMTKAERVVGYELEDLELLLDDESVGFSGRAQVLSLVRDLKFIQSFIRDVRRKISTHQTARISNLALEIISVVEDLSKDTRSYHRSKIFNGSRIFTRNSILRIVDKITDRSSSNNILRHSPKVADIVYKTRYGEGSLIGFEGQQKELLERLIGGGRKLEVISIIGMAGIGKTTLARRLYYNSSISYHFPFRSWASWSSFDDTRGVLYNILRFFVNSTMHLKNEGDLGGKLYKCLKGNRYLIVIDGMRDILHWNNFKKYFPENKNGSRILMISRYEEGALHIRPKSSAYYMPFLSEVESWDLFQSKVFADQNIAENFRKIGKKIVARCKGLPLAIVVVAELLSGQNKTEQCWRQAFEIAGTVTRKIMDDPYSDHTFTNMVADHRLFNAVVDHQFIIFAHRVIEFELEDLELFLDHEFITYDERVEILCLVQHLIFIKSFIRNVQETPTHKKCSSILDLVLEIKSVVEDLLEDTDSYFFSNIHKDFKNFHSRCLLHHSSDVADLVNEIKSFKEENFDVPRDGSSSGVSSSKQNACSSSILEEKVVIGFEDHQKELLDRLIRGRKQLEVIPIIGMAGIGKTTLAKTLYNHSSILYQFHVRAWTSLSQSYQKENLLHNILSSIVNENDPVLFMSEDDMGEKLYKCLMGNRYFIVIDDIWDIQAWNDLERYFPKNENGSRILMTSRIEDVALNIRSRSLPYYMPFLTEEKSWDLFQSKVFSDKKIPEELREIASRIVARCKGLPLAIVVIAGLLSKEEKTEQCWRRVAENIGSSINNDLKQLMETLNLSYNHLPSYLKSCFLYLGLYLEDYEIPVSTLIRSWVAEGFIQQIEEKRLEEVAEEYLLDLVNRNLVMIAKKRPDGGIKSCYIHDLVRDLCLQKGEERKFVQLVCQCASNSTFFLMEPIKPKRAASFSDCQYFHFYKSHYAFESEVTDREVLSVYKFLQVLDLRHMRQHNFPEKLLQLFHLRFLALQVDRIGKLPASLFDLWNLETFILEGEKGGRLELTPDILKMNKLRHFEISQELFCDAEKWMGALQRKWMEELRKQIKYTPITILDNLQSLSHVCPSVFVIVSLFPRIQSLRKLGLHLTLSETAKDVLFPNLSFSVRVEKLKFEYQTLGMVSFSIPHAQLFPPCLKKLTLIGSHAEWREMSIIGMLPNLEVLKLKDKFFSGQCWETCDDGFPPLKFLKLSHMDLQQWISYSSHFPQLQQLVLNGCLDLEQIPLDIGDIPTLHTIEVYRSSDSAVESAKEILEMQESLGNEDLKVYIYQQFQEF